MTHEVVSVTESIEGNASMPCWRVEVKELATNRQYVHIFPKGTLEWRAAEYGVDVEDHDTLLSMILHEPHLEQALPGFVNAGEVDLWGADNTPQVRKAHLKKIKDHPVNIPIKGVKHLDVIRKTPLRGEEVKAKAQLIDEQRWFGKYGGFPLPPPTGTPSHPKPEITDSMGVGPKAKEALTVIVGKSNAPAAGGSDRDQ